MYRISGYKTFKGHGGEPLAQGNLNKGSTKVAEWSDDSWGGPFNVRFIGKDAKAAFLPFAKEFLSTRTDFEGKPHDLNGNAEHLIDEAIEAMSIEFGERKALESDAKKGLIFKLKEKGEVITYTMKCPYTPKNVADLREKYGADLVEIVNETLGMPLEDHDVATKRLEHAHYKKLCKTKLYFTVKNEAGETKLMSVNSQYTLQLAEAMRKKHPNLIEVLNERYL